MGSLIGTALLFTYNHIYALCGLIALLCLCCSKHGLLHPAAQWCDLADIARRSFCCTLGPPTSASHLGKCFDQNEDGDSACVRCLFAGNG